MARGKTLWEMLKEKFTTPVESRFYNPFRARIGSAVSIDTVELRHLNFFLREIREYLRQIRGQSFYFTDYVLLARQLGGEEVLYRLRLNPMEDPGRVADITHHVLLLRREDEFAYDQDFHAVVTDGSGRFQVLENGEVTEEYYRINDLTEPHKARVAVIRDVNQDGKVEMAEVERHQLEYWDYWREVPDATGQPTTQYLFVEMDAQTGWFELWKGEEFDPQRIMVI